MSMGERYGAEPRDDPSVQRLVANVDPHLSRHQMRVNAVIH